MRTLKNSTQLIGHLGKDPEVKTLDSGNTVASFPLATSETYKNSEGKKIEDTQWHNIVVWGKRAELVGEYLKKGSFVALEGRLTHDKYEDNEGVKRYSTKIVMNEFTMLDKKATAPSTDPGPQQQQTED